MTAKVLAEASSRLNLTCHFHAIVHVLLKGRLSFSATTSHKWQWNIRISSYRALFLRSLSCESYSPKSYSPIWRSRRGRNENHETYGCSENGFPFTASFSKTKPTSKLATKMARAIAHTCPVEILKVLHQARCLRSVSTT